MLSYKVERKGRALLVRIGIKGARRVLYLDTLKASAHKSDAEALALLTKIHLKTTRNPETLTFERIEVPPQMAEELIRLMRQTGRMEGNVDSLEEIPLVAKPLLILKETSGCFANLWIDYGIARIAFDDFAPTLQGKERLKKEEESFEKDFI